MPPKRNTGLRGSVFPRGNKFVFKLSLGRDPTTGKRRDIWETYPTEDAALDRQLRANLELRDGQFVAPSHLTVAQFGERWLEAKRSQVRESTSRNYRYVIEKFNTFAGQRRLRDITQPDILAYHAFLLDHIAASTAHQAHRILAIMFNDAVRWGFISVAPTHDVRAPKVQPRQHVTFTAEQTRRFLVICDDGSQQNGRLWRLLVTSGLRIGEALALQWDDLFANKLTVRRTATTGDGGRAYIGPPKSESSRRTVTLPASTVASLAVQRQFVIDRRQQRGDWWNQGDLIFPSKHGELWERSTLIYQLNMACRAANVPRLTPHQLRHTFATLMIEQGIHWRVAQERMGHASPAITMRMYQHVSPAMDADAADQFEAMLNAETG